ncbi:MAG: xanthine dehydrogenase molybdopterin binding subunit [Dactylosporangium sp.]|jgi:xanthine dehydrogenase YagR molybdenum-binding subunit|nr:xanthine dehydrogenase molybdopterin binding subunit [Dactylosporangium sp.]
MSTTQVAPRAVGTALDRLDGPDKVRGAAIYAFEWRVHRPAYLYPLQATIAAGCVTGVDTAAATAEPGVLAVLTHHNAPRLAATGDSELAVLQSDEVAFRGQFVGGVVAETAEIARHAASLVRLEYAERAHDIELRPDRDDLYAPAQLSTGDPADTALGDVDAALASAAVSLDATYTTPMYHHNPMEPHATIAIWTDDGLTLYLSTQGAHWIRATVAELFGLDPPRVRVISPHVGGGFGSKIFANPDVVLAAMAAQRVAGRPVKLALTRQQMFSQVRYRTPTVQRIRLGADDGGRLTAIAHDVVAQTAKIKEFGEHAAVCSRNMYAAPHRRTTHRLAALDVPVPTWMRAPGEAPGMFALESAMDEMAIACGLDPIEFRIRNEPSVNPETGAPFSSRNLVACLREGARRFGWERRDPTPLARRDRGWLVGTGVAASTYPVFRLPGNAATIRVGRDGRYAVLIGAADLGTGTWTALTQIAADALEVTVDDVDLHIGDTALPMACTAGGSSGINSWGSTIVEAARTLRARLRSEHGGTAPAEGFEVTAEMPDNPDSERFSMHSFGAQFAEVRVHEDSGEVRVPRLLGVFAAGRIINPKTARSQLLGGMTMGLSMALHEHSVVDPRFGHVVNHDLAEYHIATNADVGSIEAYWVDEDDPYVNPMGAKGLGEVGIVGTAAAIANAAHHATGIRVRDLPITLDKLLR